MSNPNKPGGKPGQRNRKPVQELSLKEVQPQSQKPVQLLSQKPAQQPSQKPVQPQSQTPVQQPTQKPEPQLKQQPEQQLKQQETRTQIAAAVASCSFLMIVSGVPLGKKNANQVEASKSFMPCS